MAGWLEATMERRTQVLDEIAASLGDAWRGSASIEIEVKRAHHSEWTAEDLVDHYAALATPGSAAVPGLLYVPAQIQFLVVPGGELVMGASDDIERLLLTEDSGLTSEEMGALDWSLARMRPMRRVAIKPFLIASAPLVGRQLEALGWKDDASISRLFAPAPEQIIYLELEEIAGVLRDGLRLPSEAEYEHACRAGTSSLFYWGDDVPDAPSRDANALGLAELGNHRELLADLWHNNYDGAPSDQHPWVEAPVPAKNGEPLRVTRGGAATCYPWQGCGEWQLLLSCFREAFDRSVDNHNHQIAIRPVRDLQIP